jgi:rhamnogalacturonan endolyase
LLSAKSYGCRSNNGTKATPGLQTDLFGDWREATIPTERIYTLMHDPQYRLSIAWQNVGYNQPPHTSFSIGPKMADPPVPHIRLVGGNNP